MQRRDLLKVAATVVGSLRENRAAVDAAHQVNTVLGPVLPADLGRTLMHEHILSNLVRAERMTPERYDGGEVRRVILPYLKQLRSRGCRSEEHTSELQS